MRRCEPRAADGRARHPRPLGKSVAQDADRYAQRQSQKLETYRGGDAIVITASTLITFLGAITAGIVPVPVYPPTSFKAKSSYVDIVVHIVRASGARALVTLDASKAAVEPLLERSPELGPLLIAEQVFSTDAEPKRPVHWPSIEPEDLCFLQFTSGSTSMPKGVMVSHQNLIANAGAFLGPHGADRREDDITVAWLPLFHDMGLVGFVLGTIIHDIPTVLLPTEAFARRPTSWMQAMHDYRGTITFAPNFAYALAAKRTRDKDMEGMDLRRIRIAGCGAEPINPQVLRVFADRFSRAGFDPNALMPSYGMAEATLAISFHAHGTAMVTDRVSAASMKQRKATPATSSGEESLELVSCGRSFPGHEVEVIDDDGHVLPEREVGEIRTRGPSVTAGYYADPVATLESFGGGWLRTGDLGYFADGNLYVCGRVKDLIIIRGANFHPQDIERSVADTPGMRRENVVAFSVSVQGAESLVIVTEANSGDAAEVRRAIAERVSSAIGLAVERVAVVRVGSLPKTSSGKVQRRKTKHLFEHGLLEEH